jgi:hypothetical protein
MEITNISTHTIFIAKTHWQSVAIKGAQLASQLHT